jgi:hypothetical protein
MGYRTGRQYNLASIRNENECLFAVCESCDDTIECISAGIGAEFADTVALGKEIPKRVSI